MMETVSLRFLAVHLSDNLFDVVAQFSVPKAGLIKVWVEGLNNRLAIRAKPLKTDFPHNRFEVGLKLSLFANVLIVFECTFK